MNDLVEIYQMYTYASFGRKAPDVHTSAPPKYRHATTLAQNDFAFLQENTKRIQTLSTFANVPLNSSSVPRTLMRFSRNSTRYHWETSNVSCVLLNCSEFPENRGGMYRSILSPRSPDLGFFLAFGFGLSRAALRTAQMAHTDAPVRPCYGLFSNLFFLFSGRQMF